jgi:oligoendopeptidase F
MKENTEEKQAGAMRWDLGGLYAGYDDPGIEGDLNDAEERALLFSSSYRASMTLKDPDAHKLLKAIREYESIHEKGMRPLLFATLLRSSRTGDHEAGALFQRVRERWGEISGALVFFNLRILALPHDLLRELVEHPDLGTYRRYLLQLIRFRPYALSEEEEKTVRDKDLSGKKVLSSLYGEFLAGLSFPLKAGGSRTRQSAAQVPALLCSEDRSFREDAFRAFLRCLGRQGTLFARIMDGLVLDNNLESAARGYPSPIHKAHMENCVEEDTVERMMVAVEGHYPSARKYFRSKAEALGVKRLSVADMWAPIDGLDSGTGYEECRDMLLEALKALHPLFHSMARDIFERRLVDAEARRDKQSGAFCECFTPSQYSYVSMHYTGTLRDMMTLAHEIGHGIHQGLSKKQSYVNFRPLPVLAEMASTYFETIFAGYLKNPDLFQDREQVITAIQLDGLVTTVFRQNVITRFEQALHRMRTNHPLGPKDICRLWLKENERLFGDAVDVVPEYKWGWTYVRHIFERPFYCYSYVFGNLVSLMFRVGNGKGIETDDVVRLLSGGSSRSPALMLKDLGLAIDDNAFWHRALECFDELVDSFRSCREREAP